METNTGELLLPIAGWDDDYDESYFVVPPLDPAGAYMAVFPDGSYTRWIPPDIVEEDAPEEDGVAEYAEAPDGALSPLSGGPRRRRWREVVGLGLAAAILPFAQLLHSTGDVVLSLS